MKHQADDVIEIASSLGPVRLRPEQEHDHAFRFALFCETHCAQFALLPLEPAALEQLLSLQFRAQTASYRANFPNARFDVIELEHQPVGRIVVDRPGDHLHIVDQAISAPLRNRGLGSTIMQALMDEANQAGQMVRLKVAVANQGAMRLYRRLGFVPVVTEPLYIEMQWPAPQST
jgi:ribosomal protein S18 acetylase RimI-like enzyme